ncbi:MAG: hypothetical protein JWO78_261 [Micavibrio sp.]|nr:hypothetical protein [Micavibrio sp.]
MNDIREQGCMRRLLSAWVSCRRGSIVLYMALLIPVMTATIGLGIDVTQSYMVKERLARALDAAALAAAGSAGLTEAQMQARVDKFMAANYPPGRIGGYYNVKLTKSGDQVTVTGSASFETGFMRFLTKDLGTINTTATTRVNRLVGSNIELALILDISGSMDNYSDSSNKTKKIDDLKTAAKSLIDTVVYTDQSQYTSEIAIVPYAVAVNAGTYAAAVRGAADNSVFNITGATKANPVVITTGGHNFKAGEVVYISGVKGMTQLNGKFFTVASPTATKFNLSGINGTSYGTFTTTGGTGTAACTKLGCQNYYFLSATGTNNFFGLSTCVSERTGSAAYTDTPPTSAANRVGMNYPASSNPCLTNKVRPLTSDKTVLKADIDALTATGSTGGQAGIAWGWYMLAPDWGYLWAPNSNGSYSAPKKYDADQLHKVAVIMTDGEFNSPYCNGVIAKDATTGSGNTSDHINCNAPNGDSYSQGRKLCDGMKAAGIEIYTIGFKVDDYPNGKALMQYCAKDASHFYASQNGSDLLLAFQAIARNVSQLYISQ